MEEYLIEDYRKKQKQSKLAKNNAERYKRRRAIELFEQGLQDIDVLSEALETTPARVKEFLGKTRLESIGVITEPEAEEELEDFDVSEDLPTDRVDDEQEPVKNKKFTEKDAIKYSGERDEAIIMFHRDGLSLVEVADKLNLTVDQAKERYIALGLPIYTKQELQDIREGRRKANEERNQKSKKEPENIRTEESSPDVEDKTMQEDHKKEAGDLKSFEEVKKAIHALIKNRKSKKAMRLARYYARYADFLSDDERKRITGMADTIELLRAKESGRRSRGR